VTESGFHLNRPVAVRSPNWLGDAVMALPAVRNLKTMMKDDPLTVATPEKLAALWQLCPFVDRVVTLDQPKNLAASAKKLREGQFGAAVLLPNSLRTAAEAWLAGIPQRIGYATNGRRLLLTKAISPPRRNPVRLHQSYYYQDLVAALGGPADASVPVLRQEAVSHGSSLTVAICPGAEYGPAKRWPAGNFLAVAKHFSAKHRAHIVLFGTSGDAPLAEEFARELPEAENRTGKTTLAEFLTALSSARLVLCNDSGAMHAASVLGVPTVAVFGSTEPQLTGPFGPRTAVLRHHVPCSPCFLRECPIDFACMKGVTPEMAIAAAEKLI